MICSDNVHHEIKVNGEQTSDINPQYRELTINYLPIDQI